MAYPYSDQPLNFGYQNELDLSSLGNYLNQQQQTAAALQTPTAAVNVDASAAPAVAGGDAGSLFSSFSNLLGGAFNQNSMFGGVGANGQQTMGWVSPAIAITQGILGLQQGRAAQRLAEDQLSESKRQFDLNYGAQRQTLNTQLEDRQRARVASNPGAYQSVSDYMNQNRIR